MEQHISYKLKISFFFYQLKLERLLLGFLQHVCEAEHNHCSFLANCAISLAFLLFSFFLRKSRSM